LYLLLCFCELIFFRASGTCLDFVVEARRVSERIMALEKASQGTDSLWSNPRRRRAIVLLQDHAQHIGEAVDGCQTSLTTMYSVMLPRNPPSGSFRQLLETFRTSQRVHLLIKFNLIAGANFSLGWMRKWHPRLNYDSTPQDLPPGRATLGVHMDATLQPARRIISRLLQEDARFFCEHHYLNLFNVDDSDQPMS
jgi:hypothetical protein